MVGQRHVARHRHVAATDEPRIRDGVVGGAKRAGRDQRRADATEANEPVRMASWMISCAAAAAAPHRRSRCALKCGRRGASWISAMPGRRSRAFQTSATTTSMP
jgi:hypothetical protein